MAGIQGKGNVLVNTLADGVSLDTIWQEFQDVTAAWNERKNSLVSLLAFETFVPADALPQSLVGEEFEESSEHGVPHAMSPSAPYLKVGYDLVDYDLALRMTWKFLRDATSEQVRAQAARALEADARRVQRTVLQRLFDPTEGSNEWQHRVFGLYNGTDGIKPPSWLGKNFAADHNHYLVSGSATLDSEDLELGMAHLTEHGFGVTSVANGNPSSIYILVNPAEADVISTFRAGVENANSKRAKHDFIPSSAVPPYLTDKTLVGTPPPAEVTPGGLPILGQYGLGLVIQDYVVPQGYVVIVASGGPNSPANAIGLRSHERPEYRGLRLIAGNYERYPLVESFYQRSNRCRYSSAWRSRRDPVQGNRKLRSSHDRPITGWCAMAFRGYYPYDEPIDNSPSELSWGRGLRPKGCERKPPDEGGMYGGRSPSTVPDRKTRYGYPGKQVRP